MRVARRGPQRMFRFLREICDLVAEALQAGGGELRVVQKVEDAH